MRPHIIVISLLLFLFPLLSPVTPGQKCVRDGRCAHDESCPLKRSQAQAVSICQTHADGPQAEYRCGERLVCHGHDSAGLNILDIPFVVSAFSFKTFYFQAHPAPQQNAAKQSPFTGILYRPPEAALLS